MSRLSNSLMLSKKVNSIDSDVFHHIFTPDNGTLFRPDALSTISLPVRIPSSVNEFKGLDPKHSY